MVKPELGTKRTCPSCAARFYDLMKNPIVCPKCQVSFIAATLLPSKGEMPAAPPPKPRVLVVDDDVPVVGEVELVSLEDVEEPGDDETAGIEDVDLGEEPAAAAGEEETFLVEEEEGGDRLTGLIEGGAPGGKEDEEEA